MINHLGKEGGHREPVVDGGENSVCVDWYVKDDVPGKRTWLYKTWNTNIYNINMYTNEYIN